MSEYAWLGVIVSAGVSTLAVGAYIVMSVPYFDDAPHLNDLRKNSKLAMLAGMFLFLIFFGIFYLGAQFLDESNSGPLLLFAAFIIGLPTGLLLGSETWDRHNPRGMNQLPGLQAVIVATSIGLAELIGFTLVFMALYKVT